MLFLISWLNKIWSRSNHIGPGPSNGRQAGRPRPERKIWLAVLVATIPAVFAALSVGIAFGLSRNVTEISDVCAQNNSTLKPQTVANATPVVFDNGVGEVNSSTGARCALIFNGFGSAWRYDGGKYPIGLRIDSQEQALQLFGKPTRDKAVFQGVSSGEGAVISATNIIGGPALYLNGGGKIEAHYSDQVAALTVSNAGSANALYVANSGPDPALQVSGGISGVYSQTAAAAIVGTNDAPTFNATGTRGTSQSGWGIQGDSKYGVGVYAATYNDTMPALFATNGGAGAVGYQMKGGGPAFEFDGDGKIKGNVIVQGNMTVSNLAVNADSEALTQGDLVVLVDSTLDSSGNPILQVKKARTAADPQVIGVVDRPYSPRTPIPAPINDPNEKNPIAPGGQVLIATLGTYKALKADNSNGPILPGNQLVSSGVNAGFAAKAKPGEINGQPLPPLNVIGKALTALKGDNGTVVVMLTQK